MSEMTSAEIEQQIETLQKKLKEKRKAETLELRTKVEKYAKSLGASIAELFPHASTSSKSPKKPSRKLYMDDNGKLYGRALNGWSEVEKKRFKLNMEQSLK